MWSDTLAGKALSFVERCRVGGRGGLRNGAVAGIQHLAQRPRLGSALHGAVVWRRPLSDRAPQISSVHAPRFRLEAILRDYIPASSRRRGGRHQLVPGGSRRDGGNRRRRQHRRCGNRARAWRSGRHLLDVDRCARRDGDQVLGSCTGPQVPPRRRRRPCERRCLLLHRARPGLEAAGAAVRAACRAGLVRHRQHGAGQHHGPRARVRLRGAAVARPRRRSCL